MKQDILVNIMMLAYQHEKYIAQAIESVLMQKVNFQYKLIIAEDCSTDHTREIIKIYKKKYPDKIQLLLQKRNVGTVNNCRMLRKYCTGKYIAILEGDDYWIDPCKLQKQIDFLETHSEYSACYGDSKIISDCSYNESMIRFLRRDINSYQEYFELSDPMIPNASLVHRNFFLTNNYLKYFTKTKYIGDRILYMLILKHGKIKFLQGDVSCYRYFLKSKTSFSSRSLEERRIDTIKAFRVQLEIVPDSIKIFVKREILKWQLELLKEYFFNKNYFKLIQYFLFEMPFKEKLFFCFHR